MVLTGSDDTFEVFFVVRSGYGIVKLRDFFHAFIGTGKPSLKGGSDDRQQR